jgi:hypothetical protein
MASDAILNAFKTLDDDKATFELSKSDAAAKDIAAADAQHAADIAHATFDASASKMSSDLDATISLMKSYYSKSPDVPPETAIVKSGT